MSHLILRTENIFDYLKDYKIHHTFAPADTAHMKLFDHSLNF